MKNKKTKRNFAPEPPHERFPSPGKTPREDTAAVMKFYGLPRSFPAEVLEAAAKLPRKPGQKELKNRLDLRGEFVFTCDPESARDYDDALSLKTDAKGNRVLGVHIADVSHFVKPGDAIDREAFKRSTSVYLADRVVPMLPEELSNGVCSLVPGEDRLAFSVFITFDRDGVPVARHFAKSVIRSKARFTYAQVMEFISSGEKCAAAFSGARTVLEIAALSRQLRARRFAAGALDIEIPEPEVVLDADGEMAGLVMRGTDESHQMVEECMVAANEAVASELSGRGVKYLARLHEPPEEEKLASLRTEMRGLGVKMGNIANRKIFSQFLRSIKSHPLYATLAVMVLRSMKRAVYDASDIGHFGLAKDYYAHFTSPIRRYPDLTLHRQLAEALAGRDARVAPRFLERWARHSSEMEEVANEAERALVEIKKYRILEAKLESGEDAVFDGVIAKCTPYGCFVDIPGLAVSGLVHVSQLSHRYVKFNESDSTLSAPGERGWRIGDPMKVRLVSVDFAERRIDFVPVRG